MAASTRGDLAKRARFIVPLHEEEKEDATALQEGHLRRWPLQRRKKIREERSRFPFGFLEEKVVYFG